MDSKIMKNRSLFLIGMAFVILSIFFSPGRIGTFIAENLSEDGVLSDYFIYALIFLRIVSLITGLSCLVFLVLSRAFPEWIQAWKKWLAGEKGAFWILVSILILGGILRFHHLGAKSLWLDETHTYVTLVKSDPDAFIARFRDSAAIMPPFYYMLLNLSLDLFGKSEFSMRFVSCISGILAIAAIYLIGNRLFGKQIGLISALILAINVFHVGYSQLARRYEISAFLAICSMLFFIDLVNRKSKVTWIAYPVVSILGLHTSHLFSLIIFTQLFYLLTVPVLVKRTWKRLLVAFGFMLIICLPLFRVWLAWVSTGGASSGFRVGDPGLMSLINLFKRFIVNDESGWGYQVFWLLMIIGLFYRPKFKSTSVSNFNGLSNKKGKLLLLFWLVIPITTCFLLSRYVIPSFFIYRYFGSFSIPLYIFIAAGVIVLSKRVPLIWMIWFLLVFNLFFIILQANPLKKEQWREAVAFLEESSTEEDLILAQIHDVTTDNNFSSHTHKISPLDFYYQGNAEIVGLPHSIGKEEFEPFYKSLRDKARRRKRLWLIVRKAFERGQTLNFIRDLVGADYQESSKREWKGVLLYHFRIRQPNAISN